MEDLHGVRQYPGVVRCGLVVLHDPHELCHDVLLNYVLEEDLAEVLILYIHGLDENADRLELLEQCAQHDHKMRRVHVGLLPILPQTSRHELNHVLIEGALYLSNVEDRQLLLRRRFFNFLPACFHPGHLGRILVAVELQDPRDEVKYFRPVVLGGLLGFLARNLGPAAAPQKCHQRAERRLDEFIEKLAQPVDNRIPQVIRHILAVA
mmetsp:Transcript_44548/g.123384  ORF Transcript_44548/g.123384 Transcript_44548/m.123384 type:complete len:208 (-) Transcript_44548:1160-1783(-)